MVIDEIETKIRNFFAVKQYGALKIDGLDNQYLAYVIRDNGWYGLAIPNLKHQKINEEFSNCAIKNMELKMNDNISDYIVLFCTDPSIQYTFATLGADFVKEETRSLIVDNPLDWWQSWKDLLGNVIHNKKVYDVIAEMMVLTKLYETDKNIKWNAISKGSHDIETKTKDYEVKSTIKRYDYKVTISSQFQLEKNRDLDLVFMRLEKSQDGLSIDDLVEKLVSLGYKEDKIEKELTTIGFEKYRSTRDEKYRILESKVYKVDNKFPLITPSSFVGEKIPDNIEKIVYTVNLNGLLSKKFL